MGTGVLPALINPNMINIIKIEPYKVWQALKPEHQSYILKHNTAIRHNEEPPAPPHGVKLGEKKDDGSDNKDLKIPTFRKRRTRRMGAADYMGRQNDDTITSSPRRLLIPEEKTMRTEETPPAETRKTPTDT